GKASGSCGSSGGGSGVGGWGGHGGSWGAGGPSYSAIPGAACLPDEEPCNDVCCDQGQGPAGNGKGNE
ncbi:MAG: hypothetical protein KZQ86_10905, partial [Candidatus Thiodiazotropha sp. (ex Lucinoma kastoroae)]|nr:hypothetical protein [Candidatus Thiodiazotropha sp. (ex Lucinoma kastoroae)]